MAVLHKAITIEDLDYSKSLANQGKIIEMYDYLASFGDRYSVLAKGVVEGNTLSGVAALEFMEHTAEQQGKILTENEMNKIKMGMAQGYLATLYSIADTNGGVVNEEVTAIQAQLFHDDVFEATGLGKDAWTLNTPFELLGEFKAQEYWESVLETAGDPGAEFELSVATSVRMVGMWYASGLIMSVAVNEGEYEVARLQIASWIGRLSNHDALGDMFGVPWGELGPGWSSLGDWAYDITHGHENENPLSAGATDPQVEQALLSVGMEVIPESWPDLEYLGDLSIVELEALFHSDPAARFALVNGNVFSVKGDFAVYNSSELDPSTFSDEYIHDRARFLTALNPEAEEVDVVFKDLENGTTAGADPSFGLLKTHVVFGGDSADLVEGADLGSDKLYGGGGRDTLLGYGEDDYLEGNQGNDTLDGGSGNDILTGGQDNDRLMGGTGIDEYHFRAGDGADTLFDIDGQGKILIDGETELEGSAEAGFQEGSNTVWESADGQYVYTLVDGTLDEGTLEIASPELLEAGDKITINKFQNGDLGIELSTERNITLTPGPFTDDGGSADSTTLTEGGNRPFRVELNRPAEAGDRILLTLGGDGAETVMVRLKLGGEVLSFADGEVTLPLEEGQQSIDFTLVSDGEVDTTADLTLEAVFENSGGEAATDPVAVTITLESDDTAEDPPGGDQTIVGDLVWIEGDGGQYYYDFLGNRVYDSPLTASPGQNDVLQDGAGNDTIDGGGGDDIVHAQTGGDDHLIGGAGDDILASGSGDDLLEGGAGSDSLIGDVFGVEGHDRLYGDVEVPLEQAIIDGNTASGTGQRGDLLSGMDGDDLLVSGAGNDVLSGGGGDDTLVAGAGDDFIFSDWDVIAQGRFTPDGVGDDDVTAYQEWDTTALDWQATLEVAESGEDKNYTAVVSDTISVPALAPGDDLIHAGAGKDYISAGDGDDVVYAESGDDVAFGGRGSDLLIGGGGNDMLHGDDGDIPSSEHGQDFIDGGNGNDILLGGGGDDVIVGGAGDDRIYGGNGDSNDGHDLLHGGAGDDEIVGGTGDDLIYGGSGDDRLGGEAADLENPELRGNDVMDGGLGNDEVIGAGGNDRLRGGEGDDIIDGDVNSLDGEYHGDDILDGDAGSDTLLGSGGSDTLRGGEGNDALVGDSYSLASEFHGDDLLEGGDGEDILIGGGGSDRLYGGSDDDILEGDDTAIPPEAHGDDFLDGGDGDDRLAGGGGSDVLVGGEGNDRLDGDVAGLAAEYHGDDVLDGGDGDDVLVGNGGNDSLFGGNGDDTLSGDSSGVDDSAHGGDYLDGGNGNDTLIGDGGDDTLLGGSGDDGLYGDTQNVAGEFHGDDHLDGGAGADNLVGAGGADTLFGGDGDDFLFGDSSWVEEDYHGDDYLNGGAGDDQLMGFGGDDTLMGGEGDDLIGGGTGNDYLSGGVGADQLVGDEGNDYLAGGAGHDELFGGDGNDTLVGGDGFDLLWGGAGNDLLVGGFGFDSYSFAYGDGNISILDYGSNVLQFGGGIEVSDLSLGIGSLKISLDGTDDAVHIQGFDPLNPYQSSGIDRFEFADGTVLNYQQLIDLGFDFSGTDADDVIRGTHATDRLQGLAGDDRIIGLDGDDVLDGGTGADVMEGELGDDEYHVDNLDDQVTELAGEGHDHVISSIDYSLGDNIEDLTLAEGATDGTGNTLDNTLTGSNGDNHLQGLAGDDMLEGGAGSDILDGGTGADTLVGGDGDDVYLVDNANDQIIESVGGGADSVQSSVSYTLTSGVENLQLVGDQAVSGNGNNGDNVIQGNNLDNRLVGLGGVDSLLGGAGDDDLLGGAGDDQLFGGNGNDSLYGGDGADRLSGGSGDDFYRVDGHDTVLEAEDEGVDTVQSALSYTLDENVENLVLSGINIDGTGNSLDNHIVGSIGANTLYGAGGADVLEGARGNDTYIIDSEQVTVVEESFGGYDTVMASIDHTLAENVERLILTDGPAEVGRGNAGHNLVQGNAGDNQLYGEGGNDSLYGGAGDDAIEGGIGNDWIYGQAGSDTLHGGEGNDTLNGGSGADTMAGGSGSDTYIVDNTGDTIVEGADEGYDVVSSYVTHTLSNHVEDLYLTGGSAIDGAGNALDNRLYGNWAANELNGGAGDDFLDGGRGGDAMAGGSGNDTYIVDEYADQVVEQVGEGTDTVESSISHTLSDNVEHLVLTGETNTSGTGNELDNTLVGTDYDNTLQGEAGNDNLDGAGGNDSLFGDDGDDYIYGGDDAIVSGNDPYGGYYIGSYGYGGSAGSVTPNNDVLHGGNGNDHLDGCSGDDVLFGEDGDDYLYGGDDGLAAVDDGYGGGYGYGGLSYYGGSSYGGPLLANSNHDRLYGGAGADVLDGGNGDDQLYGGADEDSLDGGTGDDLLDGGTGLDTLAGGQGNDVYYVDGYAEVIEPPGDGDNDGDGGSGGDDHGDDDCPPKRGKGNAGVGNGEDPPPPGHDTNWNDGPGTSPGNPGAKGGAHASQPQGGNPHQGSGPGGGHHGGHQNDQDCESGVEVCDTFGDFGTAPGAGDGSGSGEPEVIWHTDQITENAGQGYDVVYSTATFVLSEHLEELRLIGDEAIDATGNSGNNIIHGNAAANRLDGGGGSDTLAGGAGDDTYVVGSLADTLVESAGGGIDTVESTVNYTLGTHLENLTLTGEENLTGTGTDAANRLQGNAGDNVLDGHGGDDVLSGGAGADTLCGGAGDDIYLYQIGDGLNRIEDTAGGNVLRFGDGLTAANVVARSTTVDGVTSVQLLLVDNNGNEMPDQGVGFTLSAEGAAPVTTIEFADGSSATLEELEAMAWDHSGSRRPDNIVTGQEDDSFHLGRGHDQVWAGGGRDTIYGEDGKDTLYGQAGDDHLYGGHGRDALLGGTGFDLLAGNTGRDVLDGGCQNDLLLGGEGDDSLFGGEGNDLLAGGAGSDEITVGGGNDIVLYNAGDGADRIVMTDPSNYTVSVGGGFTLADLTLTRTDGDLVLEFGDAADGPGHGWDSQQGDTITFTDWEEQADGDAPQITLQLIMEASADFDAGSTDPLLKERVQQFDFNQLVEAFEASGQDRWAVTDALLESHLENDSDAALGGNLAQSYGTTGSIGDLPASGLIGALSNPELGKKPQPLTLA